MLVPVRLKGVLINGTLIDSGSSFSMISVSTLAALPVSPSVEPFACRAPNIVDIGGSPLYVLNYIDEAVAVADVEVRHPLVGVSDLAFQLLLTSDILKPHRASIKLGNPDVVRLGVDRCPVCVKEHIPVTPQRDVAAAVVSVLWDTTLHPHAAN